MSYIQIGRNSVADIKFGAPGVAPGAEVSYKGQFQFFSIRSLVPQTDASTFADEPNTAYEPGETIFIATQNGLLKKGSSAWQNMLPAPQKVSCIYQFDASCTVAGVFNFEDTLATRGVNTNSVLAGTSRSTGVVTVSWVSTG